MIKTEISENITAVSGDMFDPELEADGFAVFIPCGLTSLRAEAEWFARNHEKTGVAVVTDWNTDNRIYPVREIEGMVFSALDRLHAAGAKRVSMNSVRTTEGAGGSERWTLSAVKEWLRRNPAADMHVLLVDRRGGFSRI